MAYFLFFSVILLNIACVLMHKKSKIISVYSVIALAFVMGYAGTSFGDLDSYEIFYYSPNDLTRFEAGYIFINDLFSEIGFTFEQFRVILFILCSLLLFFSVRIITDNYNAVILLYALSMFYFLSVALRFYIAFSIAVFAMSFLLKKSKTSMVCFLVLLLFATLFHKSVIVLLVYMIAFLPQPFTKKMNRTFVYISFLSVFFSFVLVLLPGLITPMANFVNSMFLDVFDDMDHLSNSYLSGNYSRRYSLYIIFYIVNVLAYTIAVQNMKRDGKVAVDQSEKVYTAALIHLMISFLIILSQTFIRLLFIPMFFMFAFLSRSGDIEISKKGLVIGNYRFELSICNVLIITCTALTWFVALYVVGDLGFDLGYFLSTSKL